MQLLEGSLVAKSIKDDLKQEIEKLDTKPCLALIRVGEDFGSKKYVGFKVKACEYTTIESLHIHFPETVSEEELLNKIYELNNSKKVTAILVQVPLPKHINKDKIINAIRIDKDADCFHPYNVGKLYNETTIKPCTPSGIIEILKYYNIPMEGKNCVIIGRSDIVGKPMSQLMLNENATVTVCHSKTKNLQDFTKNADILISAIGKAKFVKSFMIKKDAVVIDVGMNKDENGKTCGDVDFEDVKDKISYITPVPGGVGPLTIAMLLKNTITLYKIQNKGE